MDVVWLVLDSLSFSATSFDPDGPQTTPRLADLAEESGVVFTNAYAPGPSSPSSHGSFFTGELPSKTGMHEAHPFFDGGVPTIAEKLTSHRSFMISSNPFIFNGLYRGFDEWDDLKTPGDPPFESATDPATFDHVNPDSTVEKYRQFLLADGKPFRSLANGLVRRWQRQSGGQTGDHAETVTDRIRDFLDRDDRDAFVVANYMDVHPPLRASDEALARFASDWSRDELPIGARGNEIHERIHSDPNYEGEDMYALYKAAIWDLDQTLAPLVEDLVARDAIVVVTADHGNWFRRRHELDEERIHVPLVIFAPGTDAHRVSETVNIRSLPRTTMEVVNGESGGFDGVPLLDVDEDQVSITEFIHRESEHGVPVTPSGELNVDESIVYQIAAIQDGARVDHDGESFAVRRDSEPATSQLEEVIENLRSRNVDIEGNETIDYDDETRQRLADLGYLE